MCSDLGEGSRCCAAYSIVGAIFTLWVAIMLTTQPFFITGIDDVEEAKASAFGAFVMFMVTFFLSAAGMFYDSQFKPDPMDIHENGDGAYQLANDNFPNYGTSS